MRAFRFVAVEGVSSHSSDWREHVGKVILHRGMPAGTLSMTAAAEAIETDCSCAFVVGSAALSPLPYGSAPQPSQRLPALLRVCMGAAVR